MEETAGGTSNENLLFQLDQSERVPIRSCTQVCRSGTLHLQGKVGKEERDFPCECDCVLRDRETLLL